MNQPICPLGSMIDHYLLHKRSLGRQYNSEEWILGSLRQFLRDQRIDDLDQVAFESWCRSFEHLTANGRRVRQRVVRNFCLYRRRTDPGCFVPDIHRFPRPTPPAVTPVIFGAPEVGRMLAAAGELAPAPGSPLRPWVMRLAVVFLHTAGLRRGEVVRLTLADVDNSEGVLRIRDSKFHKSRFVPLSPDARKELRRYLVKRLRPPFKMTADSPLLCNRYPGRGYSGHGLACGINALFQAASVQSSDGRRPRVHDFRHSFAVQALLRWYREGVDVQSNLPKLALYMGHVSIVSTAYYLNWMPEVIEAASQRFESQFGHLVDGGLT
jgi:integrase/recombinase XerD